MKVLGWILIIVGILSILAHGMYLSFEGITNASVPIIGGIILILLSKRNKK